MQKNQEKKTEIWIGMFLQRDRFLAFARISG